MDVLKDIYACIWQMAIKKNHMRMTNLTWMSQELPQVYRHCVICEILPECLTECLTIWRICHCSKMIQLQNHYKCKDLRDIWANCVIWKHWANRVTNLILLNRGISTRLIWPCYIFIQLLIELELSTALPCDIISSNVYNRRQYHNSIVG